MTTGSADRRGRYPLRATLPLDGTGAFLLPVLLLAAVPVLVVLDVPVPANGLAVIVSAIVLGGCGVVMAAAMARTMLRGESEHPEMTRFLARSGRQPTGRS